MISIPQLEGECRRNILNLRKVGVILLKKGISLFLVSFFLLFSIPLRIIYLFFFFFCLLFPGGFVCFHLGFIFYNVS